MVNLPTPDSGGSFMPPPSGTFPAICYRIVDLGTQDTNWQGTPKRTHKLLVSWEIHDENAKTDDGRCMSVHQQYTWSMHEKSSLRKDLESWRGKQFAEADFGSGGFDIQKLLGQSCFMGLIHVEKEGNTYANISAISQIPKGVTVPTMENEPFFFWLDEDDFSEEKLATLSERLQEKIRRSPEYMKLAGTQVPGDSFPPPMVDDGLPEDSIPF